MRTVTIHQRAADLVATDEGRERFRAYVDRELEDAISARQPQEAVWRDDMRQYDGVPKNPVRNVPIENAPNIEVTLGAIATDAVYAQAVDLIFNVSPWVTARSVGPELVNTVKALHQATMRATTRRLPTRSAHQAVGTSNSA